MSYRLSALAFAGIVSLVGTGCAKVYNVRTRSAPSVTLAKFRTFQLRPTPEQRGGEWRPRDYDPMLRGSVANRALRASVKHAFEERGYIDVELRPDFVVAVYGRSLESVDLTQWPAGFPYAPDWWWTGLSPNTMGYDEGTVLIDVLDPESLDLLWRGSAKATLGPDPQGNALLLETAAAAIIAKFPRAKAGRHSE